MRALVVLLALVLGGCFATPREPQTLESRACPPLPMLSDRPTPAEHRAWTVEVIALYVQCAKGQR